MGVQDVRVHVVSLTICSHLSFIFITGVTLYTILSFFTCFECIPPLGLPLQPSLTFDEVSTYPTASTCIMQLRLPAKHADYKEFERYMDEGLLSHGALGSAKLFCFFPF